MADKGQIKKLEKIKKFLFKDLYTLDLHKEIIEKLGYDLVCMINIFVDNTFNKLKIARMSFEDKIFSAILIGYLLRDFVIAEELRENFENSFNAKVIKPLFSKKFKAIIDEEWDIKKLQFISYTDFLNKYRFKSVFCEDIVKELKISNKIHCSGVRCMSLQCYNVFREAYYGE